MLRKKVAAGTPAPLGGGRQVPAEVAAEARAFVDALGASVGAAGGRLVVVNIDAHTKMPFFSGAAGFDYWDLSGVLAERGEVRRGYFVAGLGAAQFALPGAVDRLRAVREVEQAEAPAQPELAISQASFLAEYRMRLRGRHRTWELGAVHMGARRPATPALDDMYVPLRLGSRHQRADEHNNKAGGDVITPYRLMQRHQNLLGKSLLHLGALREKSDDSVDLR